MEKEDYRFKNRAEYHKMLDTDLDPKAIQTRDLGASLHRYIPIPIKDAIADFIFLEWNVIEEKYIILNGHVLCTVKILYIPSYPGAEERFCTGTAAVMLNSKKNNMEYQTPGSKSEARAQAFGDLGNIFGRNLARKLRKGVDIPDTYSLRQDKGKPTPAKKKQTKKVEAITPNEDPITEPLNF